METLRLSISAGYEASATWAPTADEEALERAAAILRQGGLVALPTETVYGLGANALDSVAVAAIFAAKQRPGWDPLIVHVCDGAMLARVVEEIPAGAQKLMDAFWPGPLTLLLPRTAAVPDAVTAGRALVGVRMPAHPVALELIRRAGVPIAAPSANRFGHTSPTTAAHVLDDLDGRIDAVLDAGETSVGVESTVVDATTSPMVIYRTGAITLEQIRGVAGTAEVYREPSALAEEPREALPSPGVGLRHYAPRARLLLRQADAAGRWLDEAGLFPGKKTGVMLPDSFEFEVERLAGQGIAVFRWGHWPSAVEEPEELAQRLFAGLRQLDAAGCDVILCPVPPEQGIGAAIRDRLRKAAVPETMDGESGAQDCGAEPTSPAL